MGDKKKTRLRNPDIKKVDLVDDGANPGAKIMLYKSKAGPGAPAGAQPPKEKPEEAAGLFKNLMAKIGKALGWNEEQIEKAMDECEGAPVKTAQSFDQKMAERKHRQIYGEIWDFTYALQDTLESIIRDQTLDAGSRQDLLMGSLDQFVTTIEAAIPVWCGGQTVEKINDDSDNQGEDVAKVGRKISAARLERMKQCMDTLDKLIKEAEGMDEEEEDDLQKNNPPAQHKTEEVGTMFDVTKLSPEAQAYIASLEKRATDAEGAKATAETDLNNTKVELQKMKDAHPDPEDIFKGMSPEARKIVEDLQKKAEASETAEYIGKAKGFENLGVKADEFGPILKAVAKACPNEYPKIEEALAKAAAIAQTGEVFKEVGSAASGFNVGSAAEQLQKRAVEIAKRDGISEAAAWEKAGQEDGTLLAKYREEMRK